MIELDSAELCNYAIQHGLVWNGAFNYCVRYDRACKPKQCFKCHKYGHIGAQCKAPKQLCGYCSGEHDSKACSAKEKKCAACQGGHSVWENVKCPVREREMARVEEARALVQVYPYWVMPPKPKATETPSLAVQMEGVQTPSQASGVADTHIRAQAVPHQVDLTIEATQESVLNNTD